MNDETRHDNIPNDANSNDAAPYDGRVPYYEYSDLFPDSPANSKPTPIPPAFWYETPAYAPYQQPRRFSYRLAGVIGLIVVVVVAALFLYTKLIVQRNSLAVAPHFHYTSCPFHPGRGIVEGRQVRCGFLLTSEDHTNGGTSTVQLAVAIFKAPGTRVPVDPVVYLTGGPGGALLSDWGPSITSTNLARTTLGRDLILLDQRGTGYSKPFLDCPEVDNAQKTLQESQSASTDPYTLITDAVKACHQRLMLEGSNLQTYTTIENANDVHDLIHTLGYKQVDLEGSSYGTRLALTVMRLFPTDIRSVVLDSTVPTQENIFKDIGSDTQRVFDVLFQGCAASPKCNSAYPHLATTFYQLVNRLNAHPATLSLPTQQQLSGDDLADWLYHALYDTRFIPQLPRAIVQVSQGDYSLFAQEDALTSEVDRSISFGMYYSVACGEDMNFLTERDLENTADAVHLELHDYILSRLTSNYALCQVWQQKSVPPVQKQPVVSTIPTLVLAGEYDPATPPANGKLAASTLSKSYFFQFPATGHGVVGTDKCPDAITTAFLNNPGQRPDARCIASMPEPAFQ